MSLVIPKHVGHLEAFMIWHGLCIRPSLMTTFKLLIYCESLTTTTCFREIPKWCLRISRRNVLPVLYTWWCISQAQVMNYITLLLQAWDFSVFNRNSVFLTSPEPFFCCCFLSMIKDFFQKIWFSDFPAIFSQINPTPVLLYSDKLCIHL